MKVFLHNHFHTNNYQMIKSVIQYYRYIRNSLLIFHEYSYAFDTLLKNKYSNSLQYSLQLQYLTSFFFLAMWDVKKTIEKNTYNLNFFINIFVNTIQLVVQGYIMQLLGFRTFHFSIFKMCVSQPLDLLSQFLLFFQKNQTSIVIVPCQPRFNILLRRRVDNYVAILM